MALFGTAGIRGPVEDRVTPELALAVGQAAGLDAADHGYRTFVVGRDGRCSGPTLERAVVAGLLSTGAEVRLVGQVPTPALAFASRGRRGIMLTASHNPPADNGLKLFHDGVEYGRAAEGRIETRLAAAHEPTAWTDWGSPHRDAILGPYRTAVTEYARGIGAPLAGLRVAIDCGNGMAGVATPHVLRDLGAHVATLSANVDGWFTARESKPTPDSLEDLRAFVADGDWEIGFGADGDADRLVIVDREGAVVHEDTILAILAEAFVAESQADDPVVITTPNASARIDERVDTAGGRVERVALGYLHDGIVAVEDSGGSVVFAGEPWKHVHPAFGGWIDGIASAAVLSRLAAESGGLDRLRERVTEHPYRKVDLACSEGHKAGAMERLETTLPDAFPDATVDTGYGVRLDRSDGSWLLVRPSGTEPYLRLYAEGEGVDALVEQAVSVIESGIADAG